EEIGENALCAREAIEGGEWHDLCEAVRSSWELNQRLDLGTNPPEVQAIIDLIADYLEAVKLLGAGGGGYMLMFAKDETAANQIRQILKDNPPNARARFVSMDISHTGLEVTRS